MISSQSKVQSKVQSNWVKKGQERKCRMHGLILLDAMEYRGLRVTIVVSTILSLLIAKCQDAYYMLSVMAKKMKTNLNKYWGSVENMNKLLIIVVVLDPPYKLEFVLFCFESLYDTKLKQW